MRRGKGVRARGRVYVRARVTLFIQHATRMRHVVFPFVTYLAPLYFSTLLHKQYGFRKKFTY
jgi:hypothetical protein